MKYGLGIPALLLLAIALATGGGDGLPLPLPAMVFMLVAGGVLFLCDRHRCGLAWGAVSIPPAALGLLLLVGWPGEIPLGTFAFAFFLTGAGLAFAALWITGAARKWLALLLLVATAVAFGEWAQPATWWNPAADGQIPWAPSLRWEIDRLTNFYGDKAHLPDIMLGKKRVPIKKPADEIRVLVLGTSPVLGAGLPSPDQAFPAVTQSRIDAALPGRKVRVLNAGIYGGDAAIWVYYRDILGQLEHDFVVYYAGSIEDSVNVPRRVWRRLEKIVGSLPPDPTLRRRAIAAGTGRRWLIPLKERWFATRTGRNLRRCWAEKYFEPKIDPAVPSADGRMVAEARSLIDQLVARTGARNVTLVLAPGPRQGGEFASPQTARTFYELAIARRHVHYWDPRPALQAGQFFDWSHPTPAGHLALGGSLARVLTNLIAPELRRNKP